MCWQYINKVINWSCQEGDEKQTDAQHDADCLLGIIIMQQQDNVGWNNDEMQKVGEQDCCHENGEKDEEKYRRP
jgi:hypothetical protein